MAPRRIATAARAQEPPQTLSDVAYDAIKGRILHNVYPGGYQVLEEQLCADLGMSRTPLREALLRLELEGLVEVSPRRGMRVLPLTAADIADIYQVLSVLELLAVRLLADREDNRASVERLQPLVDTMQRALKDDDLEAWARADERFHRALVEESDNPRLAVSAKTLLDQSQRFRMFTLRMRNRPVKSTRSHAALVTAIRRHDPERAVGEHSQHKSNWHGEMTELMARFGILRI